MLLALSAWSTGALAQASEGNCPASLPYADGVLPDGTSQTADVYDFALFSAAYHIMALAAPEADRTLGGRPLSIVQAQGHGLRDAAARSNVETLQKNVALTQKFYESLNTKENVYIRLSLDTIRLKCEALEGHPSDTLDELRRSMKSTQKAGG